MTTYQRQSPARDLNISEINETVSRAKISGTIVNKSDTSILVNDGTGQIKINLNRFVSNNDINIGTHGRFLIYINRVSNQIIGYLVAFHKMNDKQLNQYRKLIRLEKKIMS